MTARGGARQGAPRGPQARRSSASGGRAISPGVVFLAIALIGSVGYALYAVTVREADQIPMLASGAVVLAIAFGALAIYCLRALWRAGEEGRGRRAVLLGILGGGAAMAAFGGIAGAYVLFRLAQPG